VFGKYEQGESNIKAVVRSGGKVYHNIDGTKLDRMKMWEGHRWDFIIFNFPHLGGSKEEDVKNNQELLSNFFKSAQPLLKSGGHIHVALRDTPFYQSWDIVQQATDTKVLIYEKRVPFDSSEYPGYVPQRTHPAFREAAGVENSYTYIFKSASRSASSNESGSVVKTVKNVDGGRDNSPAAVTLIPGPSAEHDVIQRKESKVGKKPVLPEDIFYEDILSNMRKKSHTTPPPSDTAAMTVIPQPRFSSFFLERIALIQQVKRLVMERTKIH
jgi:hypothetical protein